MLELFDIIFLLIGIFGIIFVALNFILEATNKLNKNHHVFAWLNLISAFFLFLYSYYNEVWLFVVLNGFLILVGFFGLYRIYKKS